MCKLRKTISIFLCLFWMGFIFYMSSYNGEISHEQSTEVVNIIENAQSKLQSNNENKAVKGNQDENNAKIKSKQAKLYELDHIIRKNAHGFLYMVLALLVSGALFTYNKKGKDAIIYILFICLFYSVSDEFHQSFIPGRTSLVSDILVDFSGALIGLLIFYLFYYKVFKRSSYGKRA